MKTLDEVIAELEDEGLFTDALHYLKVYRMKRKALEYKSKRYDEMCETIQKQGQEHEDRCQAEIARYQEAVKNCEAAELKYHKLAQNFAQLRTDCEVVNAEIPLNPNVVFRPEGVYCGVCGSRLDQDPEEE